MKKTIYLAIMLCITLISSVGYAQQSKKSAGNIAVQPLWGPEGYTKASYYYLPELKMYYSVDDKKFIYQENEKWIFSDNLPAAYENFDLSSTYKVVINRPTPYLNFKAHDYRYGAYAALKNKQVSIAQSNNPKYFVITGHPKADEGLGQ